MIQERQKMLPIKQLFHRAGIAGYLLLMREVIVVITSRGHHDGEYTDIGSQAIISICYTLCVFAYLFNLVLQQKHKPMMSIVFSKPVVFFLAYTVFAMLSTLWSVIPSLTGYRAFECLVMMALLSAVVAHLNRTCSEQDMLEWLMLWAFWLLIATFLRRLKLGGGISILLLGRQTIPPFFFLALYLCKRKWIKLAILMSPIYALSNKVYFGIAGGLLATARGGTKKDILVFLLFAGVILISVLGLGVEDTLHETLFRGREAVSVDNMSGRWNTWTICLDNFWKAPVIGKGFVAAEAYLEGGGMYMSVHCMLMSALVGLGIIGGLLAVLFSISWLLIAGSRVINTSCRAATLASAVLCLIMANAGPGLGARIFGSWMPSLMICVFTTQLYLNGMRKVSTSRNVTGYTKAGTV